MKYFTNKDPGETSWFGIDFSGAGITVSSGSMTATPTGLTLANVSVQGNVVRALISGGTLGTTYTLTGTATDGTEMFVASALVSVQPADT